MHLTILQNCHLTSPSLPVRSTFLSSFIYSRSDAPKEFLTEQEPSPKRDMRTSVPRNRQISPSARKLGENDTSSREVTWALDFSQPSLVGAHFWVRELAEPSNRRWGEIVRTCKPVFFLCCFPTKRMGGECWVSERSPQENVEKNERPSSPTKGRATQSCLPNA